MGFFKTKRDPKPEAADLDLRCVAGVANADRESRISRSLGAIGAENFPDNPDNTWNLLETRHLGDQTFALVEPEPNDVGYDRFVFVFRFDEGDAAIVSTTIYCLEGGVFGLLATTPESVESNAACPELAAAQGFPGLCCGVRFAESTTSDEVLYRGQFQIMRRGCTEGGSHGWRVH